MQTDKLILKMKTFKKGGRGMYKRKNKAKPTINENYKNITAKL